MMMRASLLLLALLLAACGGNNSARYLVDAPASDGVRNVRVRSIEVRDVVLPAYAAAIEIAQQDETGALRNVPDTLWADEPVRGITAELARSLDIGSSATVAAEPWPLDTPADVQLTVRVERMVAGADGHFTLSGQCAIAAPDGVVRERLVRFDIRIPLKAADASAIAAATGQGIAALADDIIATLSR
ncbi:PqiC family protein [Defluviimonas sp. SAOS-178_SWC]|uniref:PqiC family protein n=1 Tax=Defluviimonas sp. SAOS-178_SWC TaxID=3121287 RepID=UPI0032214D2E